jgi:hypothetical protein
LHAARRSAARDVADQPDQRVNRREHDDGFHLHVGPIAHEDHRDDRAGDVTRDDPEAPRAREQRSVGQSEHEVQPHRGQQGKRDPAHPRAEVAHGRGGDIAARERGAEQRHRTDERSPCHDRGQRLLGTMDRDEHGRRRPHRDQHHAHRTSGAERHPVADQHGDDDDDGGDECKRHRGGGA